MLDNIQLEKTPLYESHRGLKARMGGFGGWDMPIQYEGILAEYEHTRQKVSLFDISHMGEFFITGGAVETGLDKLLTMAIEDMPLKTCKYGAMLNSTGGVIDDLIVFRMEETKWFLVVNASTTDKDKNYLLDHLSKGVGFKDVSRQIGKIDVQGPLAREVLLRLVKGLDKLNFYTFDFFDLLGENVLISRTGYTGELGYEIYYPWKKTQLLWEELLKFEEVKPAGLGARDVLRLEVGYSLYGHELREGVSILESGLGKFVDFNKDFIGKEALMKQKETGLKKKMVGFISDTRKAPREGHNLMTMDGSIIGEVTSGTYSPYLNKGIGLGFINAGHSMQGEKIFIGDAIKKFSAEISSRFFYKEGSLKA